MLRVYANSDLFFIFQKLKKYHLQMEHIVEFLV